MLVSYYRNKVLCALVTCHALLSSVYADPLIVNGDFETGDLTGWTELHETDEGEWSVYSGTTTPISHHPIDPPPQGNFAAVGDQSDPASMLLYQDVVLPVGKILTLEFIYYYTNYNNAFFAPDSLHRADSPNQQARVDVMKPVADPYSVAPEDILANIVHTLPGDPLTLPPTTAQFDLTPFAGQTVRIRFAIVDTQFFFNFAIDAVQIIEGKGIPTNFTGKVINNRFLTETDRVHHLSWIPAPDQTVLGYHIVRNGKLIATIPPAGPYVYNDHNRSEKHTDTYILTAFYEDGTSSPPLTVTLQ